MKKIYRNRGATIAIFISLMSTNALAAPAESVIYNFTGNGNGFEPFGGLIADAHGALYGTTIESSFQRELTMTARWHRFQVNTTHQ